MDYQCAPDIDRSKNLTANSVRLFQRFKQDVDKQTVETLLDEEVARHIRLCELAILNCASCGFYWARLPDHPIQDVNVWADRHLEEKGFKIEHRTTGRQQEVENDLDRSKRLTAVEVEHCSTASWLHHSDNDGEDISAEWRRRAALEEAHVAQNPPAPRSEVIDGQVNGSKAIWAAVVDSNYLVEVQRIFARNYLCLFDATTKAFIHYEETNVAFGATFGPDVGDVALWQERALAIIDTGKADNPRA